ncbi:GNAT family N-acetyltransferase [Anaerocolumna sedimenticola]|uniref:GNAT family N-acetyltransferase n=2 Tax=Anaerocolumna sedimenticola TaxID=2696063 RepID=A0A6P1TS22_9FIRM|nr:GNAT family N-acetyltransferase [Anaerocolumna sedimenticola]QHQ63734.1 GNAT family N-acetyltransferase [Anaerocolumna sedimenticola]
MNTNLRLFHTLETDNICFKSLVADDTREIHTYASDEEVSRFIGWKLMKTVDETREFIETMLKREAAGTHMYASVVLKATQAIIGTVMIFDFDQITNHAEIGYVFHKDYWGKGYGSESVALLTDFAFDTLKLHKLHASVVDANIGSARILEKNGYELEGRIKDHFFIEDIYYNQLLYGKINNK